MPATITNTLRMSFTTAGQRTMTLSLTDPRSDLTAAEVTAAMQMVIDRNIFDSPSGAYMAILGADIDVLERTPIIERQ